MLKPTGASLEEGEGDGYMRSQHSRQKIALVTLLKQEAKKSHNATQAIRGSLAACSGGRSS